MKTMAIRLTPKASSNRIGEIRKNAAGEEQLSVYVTAVPEDGKANKAMIRLLSKHLNVPVSKIQILHGLTSRNKKILIIE